MKQLILTSTVIAGLCHCGVSLAQTQPAGAEAAAVAGIQASAKTFTEAFNSGNVEAVAAHWTEDGDYVDEAGQKFSGRAAIAAEYKKFFDTLPGVKIKLQTESIRLIDANNAVEDGFATLDPLPSGIPARSRYTALHTKKNGQWLMTAVRDSRVEIPADPGRLEDLDFLVGTWTAEQDGTRFETTCRWINDHHLLERWYAAYKGEKLLAHGRQMIGWDPLAGRIVSWTFTNDGGFAAGAWMPHEGTWHVAEVGVMADGTPTGAIDIWSAIDKDTVSWKSGNRTRDGVALPDLQEVVLKREQKES